MATHNHPPDPAHLAGLRVLVVGLAREGCAVTRFLCSHGAAVTVTDAKPAAELATSLDQLQNLAITYYLGGHPLRLLDPAETDLLVVSPGVPLTSPFLQQAREQGLPITTESRLFCHFCPAPVVGISGSSGKTTTTTLVGLILQAAGFETHVGGNIGAPLINRLDRIRSTDWVILELSSFQLEYFHPNPADPSGLPTTLRPLLAGWSPQIGALLNITPNHLDRHRTMAAYTEAKRALIGAMRPGQIAVLGRDNDTTRALAAGLTAQVRWFSLQDTVTNGAGLHNDQVSLMHQGRAEPVCPVEAIKLRGRHNLYNVLAACTIAGAAGAPSQAMQQVVTTFTGVPHRLELVATRNGVSFYNDSIATSPERLIAALNAFDQPLILLAGGKDKDLPWQEAARLMLHRARYLLLFGGAQDLIYRALEAARPPDQAGPPVERCQTLTDAVARAKALAQPGDIVILSPGAASYDAYPDFAARGEHFRQLVRMDADPPPPNGPEVRH